MCSLFHFFVFITGHFDEGNLVDSWWYLSVGSIWSETCGPIFHLQIRGGQTQHRVHVLVRGKGDGITLGVSGRLLPVSSQ